MKIRIIFDDTSNEAEVDVEELINSADKKFRENGGAELIKKIAEDHKDDPTYLALSKIIESNMRFRNPRDKYTFIPLVLEN